MDNKKTNNTNKKQKPKKQNWGIDQTFWGMNVKLF